MATFTAVVEGLADEPIVRRLLGEMGHDLVSVHGRQGKGWIDARLAGFNRAAERSRWFVLRDLDHDAECAPALVRSLLPAPAKGMHLRIAVREADAWLLADAEEASDWLGVSLDLIPRDADAMDDPKRVIVDLARRSRRREIREDLTPSGPRARVGPGYVAQVTDFVRQRWRPRMAGSRSPSLAACLDALS